jgi:tripeptide aminopeptidase
VDTLLDRFCRYVKVETTSDENVQEYPSSPGQLVLGKMLVEELRALNLIDVNQDENGQVMATIPGNVAGAPTIAWLAHLDTSPEVSGKDVKPIIHRNYDGREIVLPGDPSKIIRPEETTELADLVGKTLITSDGTTLLGADDKAGVAAIMTAADQLMSDPSLEHGPIRILFTVDEEIARGTDKVDVESVGAVCAYTLDAEGQGEIENETFSADKAEVTITGINIHPGWAKNKMVNAVRLAAEFLVLLPKDMAPETTEGREQFIHPDVMSGNVSEVKIRMILRSFETADLAVQAELLRHAAKTVMEANPRAEIKVDIEKQYRNMLEDLAREPRAVDLARQAFENIGVESRFASLRGGTDGARLSECGLPTPNLSTGMHNFHSPLEFGCLEEMETAVKVLVELARLWAK